MSVILHAPFEGERRERDETERESDLHSAAAAEASQSAGCTAADPPNDRDFCLQHRAHSSAKRAGSETNDDPKGEKSLPQAERGG